MPLNKEEIRLLDLIEQEYFLTRLIPSASVCNDKFKVALNVYKGAFTNPDFLAQLEERGVVIRGIPDSPLDAGTTALTPKQLAVFNCILDMNDNRSDKKKLQDLKVSTQQYEAWLRDPAVQHYLRERTEGALQDNQFQAHLALIDRVKQGDVPAIKYFNEITGRYAPGQTVDVAMVLTRVTEIIMKNVKDPELQAAIAEDLLGLAAGVGISSTIGQGQRVGRALPAAVSL